MGKFGKRRGAWSLHRASACLSIIVAAAAPAGAQTASTQFTIPAQSLDDALLSFGKQAKKRVVFDPALTKGLHSGAVSGASSAEQALRQLLAGTGLHARETDSGAVTIEPAAAAPAPSPKTEGDKPISLAPLNVTAGSEDDPTAYNVTHAGTATRTDMPIMETPFSVQVVPQQVLQDQQAVRIEDAVRNVSGVNRVSGIGNGIDSFNIRGFDNGNSVYRDGMLFPSIFGSDGFGLKRDLANVERVEVLKGPASILYGRAEPGGIINIITKQPLETPHYSAEQQFGSFDFYRTTLDATGPVEAGGNLFYRVNAGYENSGSFEDFVYNHRVFLSPVLRWNIDRDTEVTFDLEYLHTDDHLNAGVPILGNRPAMVSRERSLGEPWADEFTDDILVGFHWSHAFNENWTLHHRFYADFTLPDGPPGTFFKTPRAAADGTITPAAAVQLGLSADRYFSTLDLTGKLQAAGTKHTVVAGADYYRTNESLTNQYCCVAMAPINIFNPTYTSGPPAGLVSPANAFGPLDWTTEWYGLFLQDQVELPFNLFALGGFRYDNAVTFNNVANKTIRNDDQVSPRGGLLWRPVPWLSLYGSYTENFGASNGLSKGNSLPSQTAQQWETGLKTESLDGRFTATVSYFDLTKQNLKVPDPNNRPFGVAAVGEAETRGVEADLAGEILPGWRVIGSYTYMPFAKITQGNALRSWSPAVGNRLNNVPLNSGSLWTTYEFEHGDWKGLKLGAGIVAVGSRQGTDTNTYQLPGYKVVNLSASYSWMVEGTKLTAQINLNNLLDEYYFVGSNAGSTAFFGAPRTVMAALRAEF